MNATTNTEWATMGSKLVGAVGCGLYRTARNAAAARCHNEAREGFLLARRWLLRAGMKVAAENALALADEQMFVAAR